MHRVIVPAALALLLAGCTSSVSEEVRAAAQDTCERLTIYEDDPMGDLGAAVVIFDGYERVRGEIDPDEFDVVLREECPDKMAAFDELIESEQLPEDELPGQPEDATD
jgi:hypothetical protein